MAVTMGDRDTRLFGDDGHDRHAAAKRAPALVRPRTAQAAVVALQRTAGNAAVVRVLRPRATSRVLARNTLEADVAAFKDASDHWRHDDILRILLDLDTDDERRKALSMLSLEKLEALSSHLRRHPPPSRDISRVLFLVAQALTTTWEHDYAAAVAALDFGPAAMLLDHLDDDAALVTKARQISNKGPMALYTAIDTASRWLDPEHRVVRALRYLRDEPAITGTVGRPEVAVTDRDHAYETVAVAGGKVTTFDRVDILNTKSGGIGFDVKGYGFAYEGPDARSTDWLLFFAPEAERYDVHGNSLGFETEIESHFQGKDRATSWGTTKEPRWTLDGEGDEAPFYEAANTQARQPGGAHTTTDSTTAMFDHPTVDQRVVNEAFREDGTAQVVVRMRFHAYLVRGIQVLYENDLTVEWTLNSPSDDPEPTRTNKPGKGRPASALSREHHAALVDKFPQWSVYATR